MSVINSLSCQSFTLYKKHEVECLQLLVTSTFEIAKPLRHRITLYKGCHKHTILYIRQLRPLEVVPKLCISILPRNFDS